MNNLVHAGSRRHLTISAFSVLIGLLVLGVCAGPLWAQAAAQPAKAAEACKVAGKVVDVATGQPAPDVGVFMYLQASASGGIGQVRQLTTDKDGAFETTVPKGMRVNTQWQNNAGGKQIMDEDWRNDGNWQPIPAFVATADRTDLILKIKLVPSMPIKGRVVNQQGEPVQGALVYWHASYQSAATDQQGAFTLNAIPKGRDVDLCAIREDTGIAGFLRLPGNRALAGIARVKAGETQVTIKVAPTSLYEGQASNTDGLPAKDLTFTLYPKINGQGLYTMQQSVTADDQGRFKVRKMIPGATYMATWSGGNDQNRDFDQGTAEFDLAKLKEGEEIKFKAPMHLNALMGQVVDEQGKPIANAIVNPGYSALLPQDVRYNQREVKVNAKGEFVLSRLAPGTIRLRVMAPSHKGGAFSVATDAVDFKAVLKPAGGICVYQLTVVDENKQPIKGAQITLCREGSDSKVVIAQPLVTNEAGTARLELPYVGNGQRPGQCLAICNLQGRDVAIATVPFNEDGEIRLSAPKSGPPCRGQVVDQLGKPVAGAKVRVRSVSSSDASDPEDQAYLANLTDPQQVQELGLMATADAQGRFEVARFSRSSIGLTISAPGFAPFQNGTFQAPTGGDRDEKVFAVLPATTVKGKVVLKSTGKAPPEKPEIQVNLQGNREWKQMMVQPDWTFSADDVAAVSYQVSIHCYGKDVRKYICPDPPTLEAVAGKTGELTIELEEGIPVRGKLLNATTGKPIQGSINITSLDGNSRGSAGVDGDGSWEIYLPGEGEYKVQYYLNGSRSWADGKTIQVQKGNPVDEVIIKTEEAAPQ